MKLYTKPVGPIGTNCYILADDTGACVVFDPGAQPEKLITFLKAQNLTPEYICLTHGHYDHIGAVKPIAKQFGSKIAIGENDAEQLTDRSKSLAVGRSFSEDNYIIMPDQLLKEGDTIQVGTLAISVIDTPGHTRGGITYRCENLLFVGDTLFAGDVGRTDLYGGDYAKLQESLKKLAALEGDYRVLPGHGADTTLSQERNYNPYMNEGKYDALY